jgi:hypothetical protein
MDEGIHKLGLLHLLLLFLQLFEIVIELFDLLTVVAHVLEK